MLKWILYIILILLSYRGFAQEYSISKFSGRVSTHLIEAELYSINGEINGWYKYPKNPDIFLTLKGEIINDSIHLTQIDVEGKETGYFDGLITEKNSIIGLWKLNDKSKEYQFSLFLKNNIPLVASKESLGSISVNDKPLLVDNNDSSLNFMFWGGIGSLFVLMIVVLVIIVKQLKKRDAVYVLNGNELKEANTLSNEKGVTFKKYILELITKNPNYFKIVGVTFDNEMIDDNSNPDYLVEFKNSKQNVIEKFAVECKYRSKTNNGRITVINSIKQYDDYQDYSKKNNIKVFVVLGVGGSSSKPFQLYVIPIEEMEVGSLFLYDYAKYQISSREYLF